MKTIQPASLLLIIPQLLLLIISLSKQTRAQNISSDTTLTTSGTTTSVMSPSGDFSFGFTPLPSNDNTTTNLFLLAIWFAKTVDKTIVWTANGNNPAPAGSELNLTPNGTLLLTSPNGTTIFSLASGAGSHAAMLDTGNLILVDANSDDPAWQSFDHPTDTILPTQVLTSNIFLQSRLSNTDFSTGRFRLYQKDGKLSLSQVAIPKDTLYEPYWSSDQAVDGTQLVFDRSGYVYFDLTNNTHLNVTTANLDSSSLSKFYQKGTLDVDGVFRHYKYPKDNTGGWQQKWNIADRVPRDTNICLRPIPDDYYGSGVCGYNSFCQTDVESDQLTTCKCPSNYSFIDSRNQYSGCSPDFDTQRCDVDDTARFQLVAMTNTDWPRSDYEHYTNASEEECREFCLKDCLCAVAIFRNVECWKKRLPLSNGRTDSTANAFIKVAKDGSTSRDEQPAEHDEKIKKEYCSKAMVVVGSTLLGGSVLINLFLLAYTLMVAFYSSRKRKQNQFHPETLAGVGGSNLHSFTYKQLHEATNGFNEELGRGAFGTVYKGVLQREDRIFIAVKKLDKLLKDAEKEFTSEVRSIGQTHHKNLVRLIGICKEAENRMLVYEFMSNGSLTSFLFGEEKLEWNKRVNIIYDVAKGLLYLHEECVSPIIHCDIKSQNILLDDHFVARISDFGLAKLLLVDQTRTNTGIRGTKGYVAPEWFKNTLVTTKVDVYSYGVLMLEIICCRKNLELELGFDQERAVLVYWACDCYRNGELDLLVESDIEAMMDMRRVEKFVRVAIWCIQEDPSLRPSMEKVTQMLKGSVDVPVPPDPSSFMRTLR
ncbi:G-type lectin S-receptor-like serine/threonine-protein kinase LECRK3 [Dioscorea cayenensis subsp. rotundata]|uniref:Receptor-like serine/threonine-protein kinase n=1 Tax=Dioscorea cayennensis subsp. rotundata TaxID=55577 RepID=A0AB40B7H9_DIOCR|nr:G-type lectin S-receptor-like serine/threonine-protein kinase LECRK3 [Dioscorea cayenensis subsp. rotundata]